MDDDLDLRDFDNICRLFPLPGVVQFPNSVLPLHIFEPRYRQMTEDALASDKLITIVQLRPPVEWKAPKLPKIEKVGCLGRIIQHERLPDGRFNLLLLGKKRVRLAEELPSDKLYRLARADIIEDIIDDANSPLRDELIRRFRSFLLTSTGQIDTYMDDLLRSDLPLNLLTDILGHALPFPPARKQELLDEPIALLRAQEIARLLAQLTQGEDLEERFPPPFSMN